MIAAAANAFGGRVTSVVGLYATHVTLIEGPIHGAHTTRAGERGDVWVLPRVVYGQAGRARRAELFRNEIYNCDRCELTLSGRPTKLGRMESALIIAFNLSMMPAVHNRSHDR